MAAPKKKNNAAVFLVVGCVACLVLGVMVFAIAMSGNGRAPQPAPEESPAPIAARPTPPKTSSTKYEGAEAAVKQFRADTELVLKELADAEKAILEAESALGSAVDDRKSQLDEARVAAEKSQAEASKKRDQAEGAELEARNNVSAKEDELRILRNGQSPLIGFISVYEDLAATFAECDALLLVVNDKRAAAQEARSILNEAENDKLDIEIAAETADSAQERASAKLALNEADARVQKRRSELADAEDEFVDSQRGLSRMESDTETLQEDAARLRAKLDTTDLATIKVLDALKSYEKALGEKGKAISVLKARQKGLDGITQSTDNPYVDYAEAKKVYFEKRKARMELDREVSILEKNYLDNGGGAAAKEAIRRAKEVAADAKSVERETKSVVDAAKAEVDREEKAEKKLVKEIREARDDVAEQSALVAVEQANLDEAFSSARLAAGPDEEKRIKRVKEVADELQDLRQVHESSLTALSDAEKVVERAKSEIASASGEIRELDRVSSFLDSAEISSLISKLVKVVEEMRLNKTLGFTDGDTLAQLSADLRFAADDGALSDVAPSSFRASQSGLMADWSKAVRTADACALRLASAGSALSRDLMR